jgi:glycosyltransferase involved in cell wall biosynthesis
MTAGRRDALFFSPYAGPLIAAHAGLEGAGTSGGAETQVFLLARVLARRGHRVAIATFDTPAGLPDSVDGVELVLLPAPIRNGRPDLGWRLRLIAALLRDLDADVLVQRAAGSFTGLVAITARVRRRRSVYSSAADKDFDRQRFDRTTWGHRLFPLGIRLTNAIVVQTNVQAELCERLWGRKPTVIRSLGEAPGRHATTPEAFLWIGRMTPNKRPEAVLNLAERVPEAQFWMVGGPSDLGPGLFERVRARARSQPNVELLATRPRVQLMQLVERAVAIVSTSVYEGMPNVFLEGWARGIPALALSHDPDGVIETRRLGWVAKDSLDRLAQLARAAWDTRHDSPAVKSRCRAYMETEHAPERLAAQWERVLGLSPPGAG